MRAAILGVAVVACLGACAHTDDDLPMAGHGPINCAMSADGDEEIRVTPLGAHVISDAPGKSITVVRLDVPPGAAAMPHQHSGMVSVYVIEGAVCSWVTGDSGLRPYHAGETFFEPPGSQHLGFTNPTVTHAKVLVTSVADTGAPATSPLQ